MRTRPGGAPAPLSLVLLGHPAAHSRSPELLDGLRLDGTRVVRYEVADVAPERLPEALASIRSGEWDGANVTVPHKRAASPLVETLDPAAARLGSINVIARTAAGALRGSSTDGAGFLESIRDAGPDAARGAVILGSGGAARAVEDALARRGVRAIVVSRRPLDVTPVHARTAVIGWDDARLVARAREAGLIVQATPLGMAPLDDRVPPLPPEALGAGQCVVDLVYEPWETPFLALARSRGARALNGWPMLVGQAAAALDLWAGPGRGELVRERAARVERRDPRAG